MPSTAEIHDSADFFLPEFIQKFLPDRNSLESILDPRYFTRERHLTLEVTLALLLNMVRPGERVGYQKVIDRFFSDTGLAFAQAQVSKPPDKAAFNRARKKIPPEVCQILFARASEYAQSLAREHAKLTWNGFRVYAIDATKKNLPRSGELLDFFEAPHQAYFPQMITGVLFDVLAKLPLNYMRAPFNTPEREMALALLPELGPGDLVLLDRGYPSYRVFQALIKQGADFLIRLPKDGMFKEIQDLLDRGKKGSKITLRPPQRLDQKTSRRPVSALDLAGGGGDPAGTKEQARILPHTLDRPVFPSAPCGTCITTAGMRKNFLKLFKKDT